MVKATVKLSDCEWWQTEFEETYDLPSPKATEVFPTSYGYETETSDCNEYRFFIEYGTDEDGRKTIERKYAVAKGAFETYEAGRGSAQKVWQDVYVDHDEYDYRQFSAEGSLPGYNDDVYHSNEYVRGYKDEVKKIGKGLLLLKLREIREQVVSSASDLSYLLDSCGNCLGNMNEQARNTYSMLLDVRNELDSMVEEHNG